MNGHVIGFLLSLRPVEDTLQRDLLLATLATCPDILPAYLAQSHLVLDARLSARWLASAGLVARILQTPPPSLLLGGAVACLEHRIESIAPAVLSSLGRGLQNKSALIQLTCCHILVASLQRLDAVVAVRIEHPAELYSIRCVTPSHMAFLASDRISELSFQ